MNPANACIRKRRFRLRVHAEVFAIHRMNCPARKQRAEVPLYVYHCPECDGWHLTKRKQNAGGMARELAAQDSESTTDING